MPDGWYLENSEHDGKVSWWPAMFGSPPPIPGMRWVRFRTVPQANAAGSKETGRDGP